MQMSGRKKATARTVIGSGRHHRWLFRQWPELKLTWWTQTLPRLYRIQAHVVNSNSTSTGKETHGKAVSDHTQSFSIPATWKCNADF